MAAQAAALAHGREIFERASSVARIGVWECSLPKEALIWTDGVCDLFDLPRGARIDRAATLCMDSASSAQTLHQVRTQAIAERTGCRIVAVLRRPVTHRGETLMIGASFGLARADGSNASELFTRADTALDAAKAAGRDTYRAFVSPTATGGRCDARSPASDMVSIAQACRATG